MKTILLNSESRAVAAATIADLITELALAPETVLIEHNELALHRSEWSDRALAPGDQVEILRVAAGG